MNQYERDMLAAYLAGVGTPVLLFVIGTIVKVMYDVVRDLKRDRRGKWTR